MVTFGKISEFDASREDWKNYVEQLIFFCAANDTTDNDKKRAVLLSYCDKMFWSLSQSSNQGEKSYIKLAQLMKTYQNPKLNSIAERIKFNSWNRLPDVRLFLLT